MMKLKARRAFPYAQDGVNVRQIDAGEEFEVGDDGVAKGLVANGAADILWPILSPPIDQTPGRPVPLDPKTGVAAVLDVNTGEPISAETGKRLRKKDAVTREPAGDTQKAAVSTSVMAFTGTDAGVDISAEGSGEGVPADNTVAEGREEEAEEEKADSGPEKKAKGKAPENKSA